MPHITLELNKNIALADYNDLFTSLHNILVEKLPTELNSCKSRVIIHEHFLCGDGKLIQNFVHVNIEVLAGRSKATLEETAQNIKLVIQNYFSSCKGVSFSVAIKNLPEVYLKF